MALEFLLKLQDLMTPKLGSSLNAANAAINRTQQFAIKGNRQMGASFEGVRRRIEELRTTANKTTDWRIFKDATKHANDLEKQLDRLQNKASGKTGGIGIGGMAAGAAVAYGAFNLGKDALQLAAEREKQKVNFQVMTGNRNTGNDLLTKIVRMADVTPFESSDLIGSAKMLMQYGLAVEKVMPALQKLGDISGADKEKMQSLTMAYGKVISEGKLNGRALEEMIYAGYNPLNDIAKKTGITMAELRKQMEKGAISSKMVEDAMTAATSAGGRFDHLMEKQSQTVLGKYSTLMDNWHHKLTDVGESMLPVATGLMEMGTKGLEWMNISQTAGEKLVVEKMEMNSLVGMITSYNEKTAERGYLMNQLSNKYPELLNGIDKEKVTNDLLAESLRKVNEQYDRRIQLANDSYLSDVNKKAFNENLAEHVRNSAIAKALKNGDEASAKMAMSPMERVAFSMGLDKDYFRRQAADTKYDMTEAKKKGDIYGRRASMEELGERFRNYSALAANPNDLKTKISDPKKRAAFMRMAKQISFEGGTVHAPGGFSFADRMQNLMNGNSESGKGMEELKAGSEKAMSGQREINITITKLGIDNFKLESVNVKEGVAELEKMMKEMFLRIVNSANGMAVN